MLLVAGEHQQDINTIKDNTSDFPGIAFPLPSAPVVDEFKKLGAESFISTPKSSVTGVQTYPAPKVASGIEDQLLPKTDAAKTFAKHRCS